MKGFDMIPYPLVIALSAIVAASSGSRAQPGMTESLPYTVRIMTDRAAEQVADDLTLSQTQRSLWMDMIQEYHDHFAEADDRRREEDQEWNVQFWLELVPELDESENISDLSDQEQAEITELRRQWKGGQPPYMRQRRGDSMRRGSRMWESEEAMFLLERSLRMDMLNGLQVMLADVQLEQWPVAMRRLTVNLEDQPQVGNSSLIYPAWEVEMLLMLRQATEEDAELHAFAEAIRFPDIVLMDESTGKADVELAQRILGFEQEYPIALKEFSWKSFRNGHESLHLNRQGEYEAAAKLTGKTLQLKRRIWNVRLRFVEDLGALAGQWLGDTAREDWKRRWRERFCPTLYLEESTDIVHDYIGRINDLDEDVRAVIEQIHSEHRVWRERFKARMVRLTIEYSLLAGSERRDSKVAHDLPEAYETRLKRAQQINQSMRGLLPPRYWERFDQLVRECTKVVTNMGEKMIQLHP